MRKFYLALLSCIIFGCNDSDAPPLVACIEVDPNPVYGQPVQLNSCSANATSFLWTFPDGSTSTLQNPAFEFSQLFDNEVSLQVSDDNGNSDQETILVSFLESSVGHDLELNEGPTGVIPEDVVVTSDNRLIILSNVSLNSTNQIQLTAFDQTFNISFEDQHLISSGGGDFPLEFILTDGGKLIVSFVNHFSGSDFYKVASFDSNGTLEWTYFDDLQQKQTVIHNDNLVIFGLASGLLTAVTVSSSGTFVDNHSLNYPLAIERLSAITRSASGFILAGTTLINNQEAVFVVHITESFTIDWELIIDGNESEERVSNIAAINDTFFIGGRNETQGVIHKVSIVGNLLSSFSVSDEAIRHIAATADGNLFVSVAKRPTGGGGFGDLGGQFGKLINMDQNGNVIWSKIFSRQEDTVIKSIHAANSGNILLLRTKTEGNAVLGNGGKVIKINDSGKPVDF